MTDMRDRYPYLDDFMGSQYYQDHDDFPTLEDAVRDHSAGRDKAVMRGLMVDTRTFLDVHHNDLDQAFESLRPHIDVVAAGYTLEQWLVRIGELAERELITRFDSGPSH